MDTQAAIIKSIQAVADDLQLSKPTSQAIRESIGLNLQDQFAGLFAKINYETLLDSYRKYYLKYFNEAYFFTDALETLQYLKQQNYTLAVATSKHRQELNRILNKFNISSLFSTLRCGDDEYPKPNPQMLYGLLDELTIQTHNAVMIGDSEYDMQLANNAGVDGIAITYGVQSKERLLAYNPVACIDDIKELRTLLDNFLRQGRN
jgi:phosphoglycolate phosphatase